MRLVIKRGNVVRKRIYGINDSEIVLGISYTTACKLDSGLLKPIHIENILHIFGESLD